MSKTEARKILSAMVADALERDTEVSVFTGVGGGPYRPELYWARRLHEALTALGYDQAAALVKRESGLKEHDGVRSVGGQDD